MDEATGVHDRRPLERLRRWWQSAGAGRPIDLTAALVLATWGLLLMSPLAVFQSSAYAAFTLFGLSEAVWGVVFLVVALMISGGLATGRQRLRMLGLMGAAALFAFVATLLALGNPSGFGWAGNAGYVALCLFALRRLEW